MNASTHTLYWTDHAAERFLERGLDLTAAMERWLVRIAAKFTPEAKKYIWGKGKRQVTVVGKRDGCASLILTIY